MYFAYRLLRSAGVSKSRAIACSCRTNHGLSVCMTNSSDWCSMLENVARSRSASRCGGTRNTRAISVTWNFRVSRNCASSGGIPIVLISMPSSRILTLCALVNPWYSPANDARSRSNPPGDNLPGCFNSRPGRAPLLKKRLPNSSVARLRPMA